MSLKSSFPMDLRRPSKVLWVAMAIAQFVVLLSVLGAGSAALHHRHQVNAENERIKSVVRTEEAQDEKFGPTKVSDADKYVGQFTSVQDISVSATGFTPSNVSVKPNTKLIFTSSDGQTYALDAVSGSLVPKYFIAKSAVSEHTLVQLKVVETGEYGFVIDGQITPSLTVHVQ